jgi:hypothetical protein
MGYTVKIMSDKNRPPQKTTEMGQFVFPRPISEPSDILVCTGSTIPVQTPEPSQKTEGECHRSSEE